MPITFKLLGLSTIIAVIVASCHAVPAYASTTVPKVLTVLFL